MYFWQDPTNFFNSNFFVALSTMITVAGAIIIYKIQKYQKKQQIARLLVNEIRNAENGIEKLVEHASDAEFPVISVLPQNSWNEYSHLFTNDFNQDDTVQINNFFNIAREVEYIVRKGNKIDRFLIQVEQRSGAIQNTIMNLLATSANDQEAKTNFDNFVKRIDIGKFHYAPTGFQADLNELLKNYKPILENHSGTVLKRVAKLKV